MLGWEIYIYRLHSGDTQDSLNLTNENLLASWLTGLGGLNWIEAIVKEGKAEDLGGNGYPIRYTTTASEILAKISSEPLRHEYPLVIGDDYPSGWISNVSFDYSKISQCLPDEQLLIEAWDQS